MKRWKLILVVAAILIAGVSCCVYVWDILLPYRGMKNAARTMPRPAVIAHRGASYLAPEETAPAYLLARDLGADYLEMDVQRTKDHALVAFHDDSVARTTNAGQVFPGREHGNVEDFTLAELKQLDAGSWFNQTYPGRGRAKYAGVKILTIEEIIDIAESGTNKPALYMETKSPERHPGYEQELVVLLRRKGWLQSFDTGMAKVVFQSFSLSSLQRLEELAPDVPRVYLIGYGMPKEIGWKKLIEDAGQVGQGIGPVALIAWPWNVGKAHRAGLHVHVYTVDAPAAFRVFSFFGVDGFFTNHCDLLLRYYGKRVGPAPDTILSRCGY